MQKDGMDLVDRTKRFALQVIRLFSILPRTTEAQVIGKQVLRSGTSVGANYCEAYRGRSKAEWSDWATSDIDGTAAQGSGSESGDERINLLRNAATRCVSWRRRVTGSIFSPRQIYCHPRNWQMCGKNALN
jgi:23S rRNA-intervening sequence protein